MTDEFNTKGNHEIDRDLLVLFLNVGSENSPEWSPLGCGVEDSSAEYDWQRESIKDILGHTHNSMKKPIVTQNFDPSPLFAGDKAMKKIWDLAVHDQDAQALSNMDCLIIHKYAGTSETAMFAERYKGSSIEVTGLGGEGGGYINMNFTVTYGGERVAGTASISDGTVTFSG